MWVLKFQPKLTEVMRLTHELFFLVDSSDGMAKVFDKYSHYIYNSIETYIRSVKDCIEEDDTIRREYLDKQYHMNILNSTLIF